MKQVYKALYAFLTSICLLLLAITIILLTKDEWPLFEIPDIVLMIALFLMFPVYGAVCKHFGKLDERNRQRTRVTNLMESYQTEPHGIRYSQHRREG